MNPIAQALQQNNPSDTINSKEWKIGVSTVIPSGSRNTPRAKFKNPSERETKITKMCCLVSFYWV